MPITIGILTEHELTDAPYTAETLSEAAHYELNGVYTVASTFKRNYALLLDAHLDRMEESARLIGMNLHLDRARLRAALRTLIDQSGYENCRFRITAPYDHPKQLILSLEPFVGIPVTMKENGVKVITTQIHRDNPRAKTNEWMAKRASQRLPADVEEAIMVNEKGEFLEGLKSNFYAIQNQTLYTAADDVVLSGISRKIVLTIAPKVLQVHIMPYPLARLNELNEAFMTSSSRGVIPIVQIDSNLIGDGKPGTLTHQIAHEYDLWVENHLEPI